MIVIGIALISISTSDMYPIIPYLLLAAENMNALRKVLGEFGLYMRQGPMVGYTSSE